MGVYIDTADWWIGYYRGPNHHYVCPLPTLGDPLATEGRPVTAPLTPEDRERLAKSAAARAEKAERERDVALAELAVRLGALADLRAALGALAVEWEVETIAEGISADSSSPKAAIVRQLRTLLDGDTSALDRHDAAVLREAALSIGHADDCPMEPDRDPYLGCKCRLSLLWTYADRIESGGGEHSPGCREWMDAAPGQRSCVCPAGGPKGYGDD